jgi:tetratricopeptide (TPR) repeat protein
VPRVIAWNRGSAAAFILIVGLAAAVLPRARITPGSATTDTAAALLDFGGATTPETSADGMQRRTRELEARLRASPDDVGAAVMLADTLLRLARATHDSRPAAHACDLLETALRRAPSSYDALRLLGAVYLSLHRFSEALEVGRRARDLRPDDAWSYGVIGDAQLELGDYSEAFASFEAMMARRPSAAAYARIAYARELSGNLSGALDAMDAALRSAPPQDVEARAWYATQAGELYLQLGRHDAAEREFRRALFFYPDYPLAVVGVGKVAAARGDLDAAIAVYTAQLARTPTLDLAARIGDLHAAMSNSERAEHYYQLAEQLAGPAQAQTEAALALFLAEHSRRLPEAVAIAETIASRRHDIATEHALAWSYFKAGRIREAGTAIERALRTGSRDPALLAHAAAIRDALSKSRAQ